MGADRTNSLADTRGGLTIKFSPEFRPSDDARMRLRGSLDLARRATGGAVRTLAAVGAEAAPSLATIGEVAYKVLRGHFHLPPIDGGPRERPDFRPWREHVLRIAEHFRQIDAGLRAPIVLADAYAATIGRTLKDRLAREERDIKHENEKSLLTGGPGVQDVAARFQQAFTEARAEGLRKAAGVAGEVRVKNAVRRELAQQPERLDLLLKQDLSVHLSPDDQGSIHVNFQLLTERSIPLIVIARTIIHEASHKFCYTRDFAYAHDDGYGTLTTAQAIMNADCYGYAAVSLHKGHYFRTPEAMLTLPAGMNGNG